MGGNAGDLKKKNKTIDLCLNCAVILSQWVAPWRPATARFRHMLDSAWTDVIDKKIFPLMFGEVGDD